MSKRGIQYIKQNEPSFLRNFKEKISYKEGPNVDTKREELQRDSGSDSEDEKPQVVVLKKGDLSQEEIDRLTDDGKFLCTADTSQDVEDESPPADGKLRFKKPVKRVTDTKDTELNVTSKKKKPNATEMLNKKSKNEKLKKKNTSLLSFNDEEEDNG